MLHQLGLGIGQQDMDFETVAALFPVGEIQALVKAGRTKQWSIADVESHLALAESVFRSVSAWSALNPTSLDSLSGPLSEVAFWHTLGARLGDFLLLRVLRHEAPWAMAAMAVLGLLDAEVDDGRVRQVIRWDKVEGALADPANAVRQATGWGTGLRAPEILDLLVTLLVWMGAPVERVPRSGVIATAFQAAASHQRRPQDLRVILGPWLFGRRVRRSWRRASGSQTVWWNARSQPSCAGQLLTGAPTCARVAVVGAG